jgi:DNA-binding HxlR family transcriptional regulator
MASNPAIPRQREAKDAINQALALFQRRWTLRVLWELRDRSLNFRALQAACGDISPTVLNQRLQELREAALLEPGDQGYALTPIGQELIGTFEPLSRWAVRWRRGLN